MTSEDQEHTPIIAFDILPMASTERHEGVRIAASAILPSGKMKEWSEIDRDKLFRLIQKYNFQYLGTDNPAEIISSNETIATFCDNLPSYCSFVHVNLTRSGKTVPLQSLIIQHNIEKSRKKLSPVKTARALVRLIQQGIGMILEPYENETLIKVGKPSSSSKGGWSQARYQRQAEEVVGREAKKIRNLLEKADLPFDEVIHSTKYGAKMARYHIFKSRTNVEDVLSNFSFYPANVKVWSPKKNMITHKPLRSDPPSRRSVLSTHLRRVIVGVDPGMTTGVAIFTLNGKVLTVFSRKNLSKGQLVTEITNYGVPVMVCADVSPVPTFVSKFAATYNAEIFSPDIELSKEDKRSLANELPITRRIDSHERDAISAVMYALKRHKQNFDKIDKVDLPSKDKEIAKGLLIRGLSVNDAVESVKILRENEIKLEIDTIEKDYHEKDLELVGRINNLLEEVAISEDIISNLRAHTGRLEAQNELLRNKNRKLNEQVRSMKDEQTRSILQSDLIEEKSRQIKVLNRRLETYEKRNDLYKERIDDLEKMLWVSLEKGGLPVKILPKFSHDMINELRQERGINDGDILLILDPTGGGPQTAENLAQNKLEFIFIESNDLPSQANEVLYQQEIPVRRAEKYGIIRSNYLGVINQKNLLQAKEDYQQYVKERIENEKTTKILRTIENYQYQRARELEEGIKNYEDFEIDEEDLNEKQ